MMAMSHVKMRASEICLWEARTAKDKPGLYLAAKNSKSALLTVLGSCRLTSMKTAIPVGVGAKGQWLSVRKGVQICRTLFHFTGFCLPRTFNGELHTYDPSVKNLAVLG